MPGAHAAVSARVDHAHRLGSRRAAEREHRDVVGRPWRARVAGRGARRVRGVVDGVWRVSSAGRCRRAGRSLDRSGSAESAVGRRSGPRSGTGAMPTSVPPQTSSMCRGLVGVDPENALGGVVALRRPSSPFTIADAGAGNASAATAVARRISRRLSIAGFLACGNSDHKACTGPAPGVSADRELLGAQGALADAHADGHAQALGRALAEQALAARVELHGHATWSRRGARASWRCRSSSCRGRPRSSRCPSAPSPRS